MERSDDATIERDPRRELDPDRARGALLGLAVGDALGTTFEFRRLPAAPFTPLLSGPHDDITGGGPFALVAGQVTDDTQMAIALTRQLLADGAFTPAAVGAAYVAWAKHAFDVGNQTAAALKQIAAGADPLKAARTLWLESGKHLAGNGSLMRTAPIALFHADDQARRVEVSRLDSVLTHYDPRCQLACAAFNGAIAAATRRGADAAAMLAAARADLALAHAQGVAAEPDDRADFDAALAALGADLAAAEAADPDLYSDEVHLAKFAGFVRVAFRLAFWHLLHTPSFAAAVIDTTNRGGDSDTNGAIVGALVGAARGASDVPAAWVARVLGALEGGTGPWATTYHPRELLALLPS